MVFSQGYTSSYAPLLEPVDRLSRGKLAHIRHRQNLCKANCDFHLLLFEPVHLWRQRSGFHPEVISTKRNGHFGHDSEGRDDNRQGGLPFHAPALSHAAEGGLSLL